MTEEVTVHDVNLALTERLGSADLLFETQRWFARAYQIGDEKADGTVDGMLIAVSMVTGIPRQCVQAAVLAAWREGAFAQEVYEEEVALHAEAWGISTEEARQYVRPPLPVGE